MDNDLDRFPVRATRELLAELNARCDDDTRALTNYAVEHGVDLPEGYDSQWEIILVFDADGSELGLYWIDPREFAHES